MIQSDITSITERCFNGEPAGCSNGCPFGLDVRSLMEKVARGKWPAAYKLLRSSVVFPGVVSRLCPATCRDECGRVDLGDEPIDLPYIERAVVAFSKKKNAESYAIPPKEQSIAIVGAGVSGLACALDLAQKKYLVTVFDRNGRPGGALRHHPDYEMFADDISLQFSAVNITWMFNHEISDIECLSEYDAVYIATGDNGVDFGLLGDYDPLTYAAKAKGMFLGGSVVNTRQEDSGIPDTRHKGSGFPDAIIAGRNAARHIEGYLQTGRNDAVGPVRVAGAASSAAAISSADSSAHSSKATAVANAAKINCSRHVNTKGVEKAARIVPSSAGSYTEEEAIAEASRCMLCDCEACIDACEMLNSFHKNPRKIAMEVFTDSKVTPPYSSHTITRETYSCNICSQCKSVCPEGVDLGKLFLISRRDRFDSGSAPYAMHDFWLREMDFNTDEASFFSSPNRPSSTCEYVFYPGCQLGANEPAHVLKTFSLLASNLDCGIYLGCCGAPAYWAGDEERFSRNMRSIRATAQELGNPVFIFACATCETIFSENLPEIRRTSLYKILAEFEYPVRLPAAASENRNDGIFRSGSEGIFESRPGELDEGLSAAFPAAAVFDPCSARGDEEIMNSVRALAEKRGVKLFEIAEPGRCCGYGGLVQGGNPRMYSESAKSLSEQSSLPYIAYCANCKNVFRSQGKECAHILDIALDLAPDKKPPAISVRRQNSIYIKTVLSEELSNDMFAGEPQPWDNINLVIDDELAEDIDRKLISADDIKETIWRAETSGDKFIDSRDGSVSACLVRNVLSYWVQYTQLESGAFGVLDAYYHRMRFELGNAQS